MASAFFEKNNLNVGHYPEVGGNPYEAEAPRCAKMDNKNV